MKITVSRPANSSGGQEYILGENGKALSFSTVKEAVNYLADRNYTLNDLRGLNFNVGRGRAGAPEAPRGPQWLSATEAAIRVGVSRGTLYDWIREGKLPFRSHPIAPNIRKFVPAEIDAWLESIGREPGTGPVYPRKRKKGGAHVKQTTPAGPGGLAATQFVPRTLAANKKSGGGN
jgi:excisionase family DNA binding protein